VRSTSWCFWLLQGARVRRAMHSPPLQALTTDIKDINVFLADIAADTHEVGPPSAQLNEYARKTCGNCCWSGRSTCSAEQPPMGATPHVPRKGALGVCVQSPRPAEELAQHIRARNAARKAELAAALALLRSKPAGGARVARNPTAASAAQRPNNQPLALHSAASSPAKVDSLYSVRQSLWSLTRPQHMTSSRIF
jgi:hypothetical protein